jgi:integrase
VLVALHNDARYVMNQMGHTSPNVTLSIYAQVMPDGDRQRLRLLVEGDYLAVAGSGSESDG